MVSYTGRKILVTGGTGFIGSRLAERLALEEHAKVRVLVHDWRKAVWVSRADVELVQGDVRDPDSLAQAMQGCEIVFHCIGVGGTRDVCMSVNVEGTRNVLECAADAGVERVVYLSSIAVHGPSPPDNADEQDEFRLTGSPYGDSKVAAEEVVWQFWEQQRLPLVVIRPTFVWGPRSANFTIGPVERMKAGRWFLVDGGQGTCHAVYIDNLVDALLLAGVKDEAVGQAFLITDGQPCTWAEFFGHYARMLGLDSLPSVSSNSLLMRAMLPPVRLVDRLLATLSGTPAHDPARTLVRGTRFGLRVLRRSLARYASFDRWDMAKYVRRGRLNISKACTLLGYNPRISSEEGMHETEIWLRDQGII
jgi:nucleoside-diphosphate-sugar epimerase